MFSKTVLYKFFFFVTSLSHYLVKNLVLTANLLKVINLTLVSQFICCKTLSISFRLIKSTQIKFTALFTNLGAPQNDILLKTSQYHNVRSGSIFIVLKTNNLLLSDLLLNSKNLRTAKTTRLVKINTRLLRLLLTINF